MIRWHCVCKAGIESISNVGSLPECFVLGFMALENIVHSS